MFNILLSILVWFKHSDNTVMDNCFPVLNKRHIIFFFLMKYHVAPQRL